MNTGFLPSFKNVPEQHFFNEFYPRDTSKKSGRYSPTRATAPAALHPCPYGFMRSMADFCEVGPVKNAIVKKITNMLYYCHPYSAYERGANENMNRIIRRFFPKGTNFDTITAAEVAQIEAWLANYPHRILDWKTPQILFDT